MGAETPNVGGAEPIVAGILPAQPRQVVLEARTLAQALGAPLVFASMEINSYRVEWELKEDIRGYSLHPREIDDDMAEDMPEVLRLLDGSMAGTRITLVLACSGRGSRQGPGPPWQRDPARLIVVGTRHQGLGAKVSELLNGSTAHHVISRQWLPVVVVPVHHER